MARPKGARTRKPGARKTGPRDWTPTEREGLKAQVARLDLQGYTQRDIAAVLGVGQSTAHALLKEVQKDYQEEYVDCRKIWVMKATAAHLEVIRQAHDEIAKLKATGRRRLHQEAGTNAKGTFSKRSKTVEDGDIGGLLAVLQQGWREIAALHGLKELPSQVWNVQVSNNSVNNVFDQLYEALFPKEPQSSIDNGPVIDVTSATNTGTNG